MEYEEIIKTICFYESCTEEKAKDIYIECGLDKIDELSEDDIFDALDDYDDYQDILDKNYWSRL